MDRGRIVLVVLVGIVVLVGALVYRFTPLWPGPVLPTHATRLILATEAPHLMPAFGCPTALLSPARIATAGDELIVVSTEDGHRIQVVWPSGWAAWRLDGRAELLSRDGELIGREGDIIEGFGGGVGLDDRFHVCVAWS